ncbi:MAG: M81 family metallopeptidase, partial [Planctomycetia bacterium]
MRIAIAGIIHESNTFADNVTRRENFVEHCLLYGNDLVPRWQAAHHEIGGFLSAGSEDGVEILPIAAALAIPGGPVEHGFVVELATEVARRVKATDADGLLIGLHGAMVTTEDPSGDAVILRILRELLGDDLPIVQTLDFHGNLTAEMIAKTQATLFYQTHPHTDMRQIGYSAARLMVRMLATDMRPVQAFRKPRLIIPINHQDTAREPLASLLAEVRAVERRPKILAASLAAGFPYSDVPDMGPAVVVVADDDKAAAEQAADELAERLWDARHAMGVALPTADLAVRQAIASATPPVVLVDFGDNVGGGSAADGTVVLAELRRQKAARSVVTIADPQAVQACAAAGVRQPIKLTVGGKTDHKHGEPVAIEGVVRSLHDGRWTETEARHGGARFNDQGATAVVVWGDDNHLVLTSRRWPPFSLGQITSLGIEPRRMQILVVKAAVA